MLHRGVPSNGQVRQNTPSQRNVLRPSRLATAIENVSARRVIFLAISSMFMPHVFSFFFYIYYTKNCAKNQVFASKFAETSYFSCVSLRFRAFFVCFAAFSRSLGVYVAAYLCCHLSMLLLRRPLCFLLLLAAAIGLKPLLL